MKNTRIGNTILTGISLMVFWLLLSGHYDIFHISTGVVCVVAVLFLNHRLNLYRYYEEGGRELMTIRFFRLFVYVPWLLYMLFIAAFQVAYMVLHPRLPIRPSLLKFSANMPNVASKVVLGNSITYTPGTLTLLVRDDYFLVHALSPDSRSAIEDGSMPREVAKLYVKDPGHVLESSEIIMKAERPDA